MKQTVLTLLGLCAIGLVSAGCENDQEVKLYAAQACLDQVKVAADADACFSKVEGLETESSYLIRCSAAFLAQGFSGQRMADAFQQMKEDKNGQDPMINVMSYFVFTNTNPLFTEDKTVEYCQKSSVRSLERLAGVAKLATLTAKLAIEIGTNITNLNQFDPSNPATIANMEKAIQDLVANPDPAKQEQVGAAAMTMQQSMCNAGSSYENEETCTYLNDAITSTDGSAEQVGAALLSLLGTKVTP